MGKNGYKKIFIFLKERHKLDSLFTLQELAEYAGYKIDSLKVYYRNRLKNKFISKHENELFKVLAEIENYEQKEFIKYISQKSDELNLIKSNSDYLQENSIQAILSAIEIHNKPNIPYRYQTVSILVINGWELLLKAYITKYHPRITIFQKDGTTKPFDKILNFVIGILGKDYFQIKSNLNLI